MKKNSRNSAQTFAHSSPRIKINALVAALIAAGCVTPVLAIDRTWFGGSGDWSTSANWSPTGAPIVGDVVIINAGTSTLSFAAVVNGLSLSGGVLRMLTGSSMGASNLVMNGGTLGGPGTVTAGTLSFNSGALGESAQGSGVTAVSGAATFDGTQTQSINYGRTLNLNGGGIWSSGTGGAIYIYSGGQGISTLNFASGTTFADAGTLTSSQTRYLGYYGDGVVNNAGTYARNGLGTTQVNADFNNTGTVQVNGGTLNIASNFSNAGVIDVDAGAILQASGTTFTNAATGVISGNGTVATPTSGLSNSGDINPGNSIGHLTIDGDLEQTLIGVLNFELTSLTSFDLLTVTDDVILGGKIAVLNLGYMPTLGDSFKVMTFTDRAGTMFDSLSVNGFGSGVTFNVLYNSDNVTLQVAAVPEAETWVMMLAGLGLVGFVVRRRNAVDKGAASV